jgi:hypothetical protein
MGRQIQCPYEDCRTWYLDPMERGSMERICPHCNGDTNAYWRQKADEQQARKQGG